MFASPAELSLALLEGKTIQVPQDWSGDRLDKRLAGALKPHGVSRERVKDWIKQGAVSIDGTPCLTPRAPLTAGASLQLTAAPPAASVCPPPASAGELSVLYVDDDIIVVNKPAGLTVHPAPSCKEETLTQRLLAAFPDMAAMGGERPGVAHRIDKDTSGLLVVARHEAARQILSQEFASRTVDKAYLALCHGVPEPRQGRIDAPLGRHPTRKTCMAVVPKGGRKALSEYETLLADPHGQWALVRVRIHTGRTHQIRVHMRHMGHPLLGDGLYGGQKRPPGELPTMRQPAAARQLLHAWRLGVAHPVTGASLHFQAPLPKDLLGTVLRLSRRCQRVVVTGLPGCGKSAVTQALAATGAPVFSADACVAALYAPGADGHSLLQRRYGNRFLLDDGQLDRRGLFEAMRGEPGLRQEVEAMIHPLVFGRLEDFWKANAASPLALAEIPLILEAGQRLGLDHRLGPHDIGGSYDLLLGVHCDRGVRHARLKQHRGWSEEMIAAMESWQWSEAAKLNHCHLIVDNSGPLEALPGRAKAVRRALAWLRASQLRRQWRRVLALLESL